MVQALRLIDLVGNRSQPNLTTALTKLVELDHSLETWTEKQHARAILNSLMAAWDARLASDSANPRFSDVPDAVSVTV